MFDEQQVKINGRQSSTSIKGKHNLSENNVEVTFTEVPSKYSMQQYSINIRIILLVQSNLNKHKFCMTKSG